MKRGGDGDRAAQYKKDLQALNRAFNARVQDQLKSRSGDAWEEDVRQYLAYVAQIKEDFADVASGATVSAAPPPGAAPPAPIAPAAPSLFAASAPPPAAPPAAAPSPFSLPATGGFSLQPPPAIPGFGGAGQNPFAFLSAGSVSTGIVAEEEDDEPERPPSPSVAQASAEEEGETVLFEQKCKLFFQAGGKEAGWSGRGIATLQLRRPLDAATGGSARLLLRNDTGKPVLNAKLYTGMKVMLMQGKSVCATLFNTVGEATASSKATPTMFRFKTDNDATQLKQLMDAELAR